RAEYGNLWIQRLDNVADLSESILPLSIHAHDKGGEEAARVGRGYEHLVSVCSGWIGFVLHALHDTNDSPTVASQREAITSRVPRGAETGRESIVDDRNSGPGADFGVREFTTVQNFRAHSLEVFRQDRNHRGIAGGWARIQRKRSSDKGR